jgi:hypothetical protein
LQAKQKQLETEINYSKSSELDSEYKSKSEYHSESEYYSDSEENPEPEENPEFESEIINIDLPLKQDEKKTA